VSATTKLRMTGKQHALLKSHLFPGDGKEAAAIALCGRHRQGELEYLLVHRVEPIPYDECSVREVDRITWSTSRAIPLIREAARQGMALLKIHCHPGDYRRFSLVDDSSDRELFESVHGWFDDERPHASVVMLPDGSMFGRTVGPTGELTSLASIAVAGTDLRYFHSNAGDGPVPVHTERIAQAFGRGTVNLLGSLTVGVVGCSGTGSLVVEQLARNGVGRLVLVDPDHVEWRNLNRIVNATGKDARAKRTKVEVLADRVKEMDLGTVVEFHPRNLADLAAVRAIASCDLVFGCVDGAEGRHLLSRLAAFYLVPYIDVGVRLDADGRGGIDQICGSVHYIQPDGSSLLSRGAITLETVATEGLRRTNPEEYEKQVREKYIVGVREDRPAVISVNMHYASMAVNELFARIHGFRDDGNAGFAWTCWSMTQARLRHEPDGEPCKILARWVGRGEVLPMLGMPRLTDRGAA